jgi:hypothetical protein
MVASPAGSKDLIAYRIAVQLRFIKTEGGDIKPGLG